METFAFEREVEVFDDAAAGGLADLLFVRVGSGVPFKDGFGEPVELPAGEEDAVHAGRDDFGDSTGVAGDNGAAGGHGFEEGVGHSVPERWLEEDVAELEVGVDFGLAAGELSGDEDAMGGQWIGTGEFVEFG